MALIPFLSEIASILVEPGAYNLNETCVVFPNKRARLYLSKYISEHTSKPVWAPHYYTISELMERESGYIFADQLTLLFELYHVYCQITGSTENFDTFYPYGETLLADFDEIDKYLVNADDLFGNLSGLKTLDGRFNYLTDEQVALIRRFWSTFNPEKFSEGQEIFVSLWDVLARVYHEFRENLQKMGIAYEGMAYRKVIEDINHGDVSGTFPYVKYLFVGFNALNTSEERLFRYLRNNGKGEFFWDYDTWYTNNEIHEAGYFIRQNLKNFPQIKPTKNENLCTDKKQVLFIPVSSNSGQAEILPQVFAHLGIHDGPDIEHTALVLADESLLIPALYAIPSRISEVNVTMGYPLAGSAIFNLIDSLHKLTLNAKRKVDGEFLWYYSDVLAVIGNPVLKPYYNSMVTEIRKKIIKQNLVYLHNNDLFPGQNGDIIFGNPLLHENACKFLLNLITDIIRKIPSDEDQTASSEPVQLELLFQVYTFLTRLNDILLQQSFIPGNDILFKLIRKMIRDMHVPFNGEPLAGLQVLGILETRTLDFKNVIVLSMNEGIIPRPAEKPSFIPFSLRAGFGMQTPDHRDSIYAYYFYRLIQRAQNIAFVYDKSSGGMKTGERSRFLHQIIYEMHLPVTELAVESTVKRIPIKPIVVEKDKNVFNSLLKFTGAEGKPLSPSGLNEYLNCSLRFYFHYIAGIPQINEVTEDIDARMFGSILHMALHLIYSGFGHQIITREKIESLLKEDSFTQYIDQAFEKVLRGEQSQCNKDRSAAKPEGFHLIVRHVIQTYIRQFLKSEMESCPFTIISLEENHTFNIPVKVQGNDLEVKLGGIIDRIDNREGKIRILDYKTGSVKNVFPSVASLFDAGDKLRNDAAFQVLLYAGIYEKLHPGDTVVPGLFFMRESYSGDFSYVLQFGPKKEYLSSYDLVRTEFEELLGDYLTGLFDIKEPFVQTTNLQTCMYCPYAAICRREQKE